MSAIDCRDLCKNFRKTEALHNLSFTLEENKITGLIGRNGAGKTTLLKTIAGYFKPTRGIIRVFDQNPFNNLSVAAKMIFVDDHMTFPTSFTLGDIVKEVPAFYPDFDSRLAQRLLDYFSLDPRLYHHRLSKGMQSTFNAIIGIAAHCPLSIFDEPTTGMDSAVRRDFYRALLKDYLTHPRTILLSSHLLNELDELLEDILLIDHGTKCLHLPVTDFQEFAVGLRGNTSVVLDFAAGKKILHKEKFTADSLYLVVPKEFTQPQFEWARQNSIEILPVTANDLCIYLTDQNPGGIDDVFQRN